MNCSATEQFIEAPRILIRQNVYSGTAARDYCISFLYSTGVLIEGINPQSNDTTST